MDMEIGDAVKENTEQSVKCKAKSANPASSVDMQLFVDGTNYRQITPNITEMPGLNNGMVKAFLFRFITDRSQNEKIIKCHLLWDGKFTQTKKNDYLNITCE